MSIPKPFQILSSRTQKELSKVTVSGYNKNEVVSKMFDRIKVHDVHKANLWAAELVCSGHLEFVVNKLIVFMSTEVHIHNPKLPLVFCEALDKLKVAPGCDVLRMRNVQTARNSLAHIVTLLCLSTKKLQSLPKIGELDFEIDYLTSKLMSRSTTMADQILRPEDPKDLKVSINELATHIVLRRRCCKDRFSLLTRDAGKLDPAYWLSWLVEWDKHMSSRRMKDIEYKCASRKELAADDKTANDCVWVIWELILRLSDTFEHDISSRCIHALHTLYKHDFTRGKKNERKHLLMHAISYLCAPVDWGRKVEIDKPRLYRAVAYVNFVYAEVQTETAAWETRYRRDKISEFIETTLEDASPMPLETTVPESTLQRQRVDSDLIVIEEEYKKRNAMYDPVDYAAAVQPAAIAVRVSSEPVKHRHIPVLDTHSLTVPVFCTQGIGCVYLDKDQLPRLKQISRQDDTVAETEDDYREILIDNHSNKSKADTHKAPKAEPENTT